MKFNTATVALLSVAGVAIAQPHNHNHNHNHQHRHPARANKVEHRDYDYISVTEVLPGPVETEKYVLIGDDVIADAPSATNWRSGSAYVATSTAAPTTPATTSSSTPYSSTSPVVKTAGEFIEVSSSFTKSSGHHSKSSTSTTPAIGPTFPSGTIPCSTFPSKYGPISVDYLGLDGWIGIQSTPGYTTSASEIVTINTVTKAGYQKSQWPSAQGSTGESIGGLYCNADGMALNCRDLLSSNSALLEQDLSRFKTNSTTLFLFAVLTTLVSRLKPFHWPLPLVTLTT
ncbi:hypothetical protein EYC84_002728 [Monilinia fructicola]|uniref:Uncharacterized protein n=1 Tax=Monilinia fructicola TaxID=38448 RepID=A0A5M9JPW8_MONFR|nr:hypothetical protein EYC84_002728 [Monilinia fructicola]